MNLATGMSRAYYHTSGLGHGYHNWWNVPRIGVGDHGGDGSKSPSQVLCQALRQGPEIKIPV